MGNKLALRANTRRRARVLGCPFELGRHRPKLAGIHCFRLVGNLFLWWRGDLVSHGRGRAARAPSVLVRWSSGPSSPGLPIKSCQRAPVRRARRLVGRDWSLLRRILPWPDRSSGEKTRAWVQSSISSQNKAGHCTASACIDFNAGAVPLQRAFADARESALTRTQTIKKPRRASKKKQCAAYKWPPSISRKRMATRRHQRRR